MSQEGYTDHLLEVVFGLVVLVRSLTQGLLQVRMPLVQPLLGHLCVLGDQSAFHFSNDALPAT